MLVVERNGGYRGHPGLEGILEEERVTGPCVGPGRQPDFASGTQDRTQRGGVVDRDCRVGPRDIIAQAGCVVKMRRRGPGVQNRDIREFGTRRDGSFLRDHPRYVTCGFSLRQGTHQMAEQDRRRYPRLLVSARHSNPRHIRPLSVLAASSRAGHALLARASRSPPNWTFAYLRNLILARRAGCQRPAMLASGGVVTAVCSAASTFCGDRLRLRDKYEGEP
jgi:hypothetical protein